MDNQEKLRQIEPQLAAMDRELNDRDLEAIVGGKGGKKQPPQPSCGGASGGCGGAPAPAGGRRR